MLIEQLTEHWLSIGVGIFLLGMVLYGHYRGFVKQAVTMGALVISITVVHVAMPYVSTALKENTGIHQAIGQSLLHLAGAMRRKPAWQSCRMNSGRRSRG